MVAVKALGYSLNKPCIEMTYLRTSKVCYWMLQYIYDTVLECFLFWWFCHHFHCISSFQDIKFKAKSWIDMFGTRGAKALGAAVNEVFRHSLDALLHEGMISNGFFFDVTVTCLFLNFVFLFWIMPYFTGSIVSAAFGIFWAFMAHSLGTQYSDLVATHSVVE